MPNRLYNKQVTPKGYQKGGAVKKPKVRKIMAGGVGKAKDYPGIKEIIKLNKKGKKRFGMKMGGALKPVDPQTQKGLSKLPTEVRNKMGYMNKGGKVKKLMTPKERAEYVKKAKVSLGATVESLKDKSQPKKKDRLFQKHGK